MDGTLVPVRDRHDGSQLPVLRERAGHCRCRMETWKILPDCRLKGDGVHYAMLGIARLHNLALTG